MPEIEALDASVLGISPQRQPFNRQIIRDVNLGFEILSDTGNTLASSFGITFSVSEELKGVYDTFNLDLKRINGDDSWVLAMPARYVIDPEGIIRSVDVNPDYTVRTEPEETLQVLQLLKEGADAKHV